MGNPVVVGVWWDTTDGTYWTDKQLASDVNQIKLMNFTAIYCVEKNIMDGSMDDNLSGTWTARAVKLAESEGLSIVWAVWSSPYPLQWQNMDLNNQTFRSWFGQHLAKWETFIMQHPCITEIIFDDFYQDSQGLNLTEFTDFVRQYISPPTLIEYDGVYDLMQPEYCNGSVTEGYCYVATIGDSGAWNGSWIDDVYQLYSGNYPFHTLGICLQAFDEGGGSWTPEMQYPLINKALSYNFTNFEYWAWRWSTPESPAIATHPEYWEGIKENNIHILESSHLTVLGDVNGDGKVNLADLVLVARAFGSKASSSNWNPAADINSDGIVNMKDIALAARNFGQHI